VTLSAATLVGLRQRFTGCLCAACLTELAEAGASGNAGVSVEGRLDAR